MISYNDITKTRVKTIVRLFLFVCGGFFFSLVGRAGGTIQIIEHIRSRIFVSKFKQTDKLEAVFDFKNK